MYMTEKQQVFYIKKVKESLEKIDEITCLISGFMERYADHLRDTVNALEGIEYVDTETGKRYKIDDALVFSEVSDSINDLVVGDCGISIFIGSHEVTGKRKKKENTKYDHTIRALWNYEDLSVHELDEVDELIADIVERDAYSNLEFKL